MVTIKIQSRGDIIGAYLQTLGFGREKAAEVSDGLSGMVLDQDIEAILNRGSGRTAAVDSEKDMAAERILFRTADGFVQTFVSEQ